jgi:hypothetical protein
MQRKNSTLNENITEVLTAVLIFVLMPLNSMRGEKTSGISRSNALKFTVYAAGKPHLHLIMSYEL